MKRMLTFGAGQAWFDHITGRHPAAVMDADVFADLYRAYTEAVFNYCLFRVGNRAVAEDLTADTFERAWRSRRSFRPDRAGFNTWLFTIARNIVTDWQRRQARRALSKLSDQQPDYSKLWSRRSRS